MTDAGHRFGHLQQALLLCGCARCSVQLEFVDDDAREASETVEFAFARACARTGVDDAKRSEIVAVLRCQQRAGVETYLRAAGDQGIVGEARVKAGVLDHHGCMRLKGDCVRAERQAPVGRTRFKSNPGLEHLPVFID